MSNFEGADFWGVLQNNASVTIVTLGGRNADENPRTSTNPLQAEFEATEIPVRNHAPGVNLANDMGHEPTAVIKAGNNILVLTRRALSASLIHSNDVIKEQNTWSLLSLGNLGRHGRVTDISRQRRGAITVGRSPELDMRSYFTREPSMSRKHFTIERIGPLWAVVDLESLEGTQVAVRTDGLSGEIPATSSVPDNVIYLNGR